MIFIKFVIIYLPNNIMKVSLPHSTLTLASSAPALLPSHILLSCYSVAKFATPWTAASQASLFLTISWSLLKFMSIELMMPSNHLIFYCNLLLLPSIFPSIRVFSNGVGCFYQVSKVLELQLQHQSFQ